MNVITISSRDFEAMLVRLNHTPHELAVFASRENFMKDWLELVLHDPQFIPAPSLRARRAESDSSVEIGLTSPSIVEAGYFPLMMRLISYSTVPSTIRLLVQAAVERPGNPGGFCGLLLHQGSFSPLHLLCIQGAGMRRLWSADSAELRRNEEISEEDLQRWSRLTGGLGGVDVWRRFTSLRYCLVGVGRNGSLVAHSLARMGAQHLSLIDPDILEVHNLDAMDGVMPVDVGRSKVAVLAEFLAALREGMKLRQFAGSVLHPGAMEILRQADIVISCVDNNVARFWVNLVASFYLRPLLDIGSGVFPQGRGLISGADVRLVIPGMSCLFCQGTLPDMRRILQGLRRELAGELPRDTPWQRERAGSLRSINQLAAHTGLRLLENFIAESCSDSRWLRILSPQDGSIRIDNQDPSSARSTKCPLCRA